MSKKPTDVLAGVRKIVKEQLSLLAQRSAAGAALDIKDVELLAKLLDAHLLVEQTAENSRKVVVRGQALSTEDLESYAEDT